MVEQRRIKKGIENNQLVSTIRIWNEISLIISMPGICLLQFLPSSSLELREATKKLFFLSGQAFIPPPSKWSDH